MILKLWNYKKHIIVFNFEFKFNNISEETSHNFIFEILLLKIHWDCYARRDVKSKQNTQNVIYHHYSKVESRMKEVDKRKFAQIFTARKNKIIHKYWFDEMYVINWNENCWKYSKNQSHLVG